MKIVRRFVLSASAVPVFAFIGSLRAMADTAPPPVGGEVVVADTFHPTVVIELGVVVAVAVVIARVAMRRPGSRRPIAALLIVIGASVVALTMVFVGLFGDLSGHHTIYPLPVIGGFVVLIGGLGVAARILMGGRRSPTDQRADGPAHPRS